MRTLVLAGGLLLGLAGAAPVAAQDRPADNMQIVLEKVRADKKLLVAANMTLTEGEAKGFWPVYEAYQADLAKLNARAGAVIVTYAERQGTVSDADAGAMLDEFIAIERDHAAMLQAYRGRFGAVLPAGKVARYYQIENKIRAVLRYELADKIPLL